MAKNKMFATGQPSKLGPATLKSAKIVICYFPCIFLFHLKRYILPQNSIEIRNLNMYRIFVWTFWYTFKANFRCVHAASAEIVLRNIN